MNSSMWIHVDNVPVQAVSSSLVIWSPDQPNRTSAGHGCWTAPMDEEVRFPTSFPQWKRSSMKVLQQTGPEAQRPHGAPWECVRKNKKIH